MTTARTPIATRSVWASRPVRSVLMVCMGNICRSPTAEAVLRRKLEAAGWAHQVVVDSAGTHAWHSGAPPDHRSIEHAARRGYELADLRPRAVVDADYERFDLILAMDWDNLALLEAACPLGQAPKLGRLSEFALRLGGSVVPDPYDGSPADFERVLDLVEDACDGLVQWLLSQGNRPLEGTS